MKRVVLLAISLIYSCLSFAQYNLTQLSTLSIGNNGYSNIWGYKQGNKEYALLGCTGSGTLTDACAIINVTSPSNPVTLFKVPGPRSIWREIRTWQHYAYITTEHSDNTFGVTIVDLQYLPDSIKTKQYTANGLISNVHALHIDNGYLYLYGANNSVSLTGALIINLTDPWNPTVAGAYTGKYVHDGIVRNNKLYAGEINSGTFSIVDVTNKLAPVVLNSQTTPFEFTHNTWLSSNSNYLYTTDEKKDAFVTSYDVSDPSNIKELDRYRRQYANGSIPHNTYILNDSLATGTNTDFLVTSYYTDGITIVDAARPDNLVEVAHFDTSPFSGEGYNGAWGVYPFLPSGKVLVSDMELGLYVLQPNYQRACYVEGTITDVATGLTIPNATVIFFNNAKSKPGKLDGKYKTGIVTQGIQDVVYTAPGYQSKTVSVNMIRGVVVNQDVALSPIGFGIEQASSKAISVFPSSVKNELNFNKATANSIHLVMLDNTGKKVLEKILFDSESKVDVSTLKSGMYIVQLFEGSKLLQTEKIIKE